MAHKFGSIVPSPRLHGFFRALTPGRDVRSLTKAYLALHEDDLDQRRENYRDLVRNYYDIATDFYEYGWGQSFHFAPRNSKETLRESLVRHEHWLASRLDLGPQSKALDVGCGIGGPMRTIAKFTGCQIIGVNNNAYQVRRARVLNDHSALTGRCLVLEADFMALPIRDSSLDAAYAIEATVHAPSLTGVYSEVRRVLRPGALWGTYEWCMTPRYCPDNDTHISLKRQIEISCGIPNIGTTEDVVRSMEASGFEVVVAEDRAQQGDIPWWEALAPSRPSFSAIRSSQIGSRLTNLTLRMLESVGVVPKGAASVGRVLALGAGALVASGRAGIFTPAFFVLGRNRVH